MYIRSLSITNLRCFKRETIDLNLPGEESMPRVGTLRYLPNVTLLLGDNGSGKTSVLRAIALSALAPVMAAGSGFVPFSLVRRTQRRYASHAKVSAQFVLDEKQDEVKRGTGTQSLFLRKTSGFTDRIILAKSPSRRWENLMFDEASPAFLVLGYSANRRVEPLRTVDETSRRKERVLRYLRVASLFEENVTLMPLSGWLLPWYRQDHSRHKQVVELINTMLPEEIRLLAAPRDGEYLFQLGGSQLPFAALSDGYRAHIGWLSDLLYHVNMSCPSRKRLVDVKGIVLVDEVDLHFHPRWQRQVISMVAEALPNLQFVITTHSPLVTGTLASANVRLIEEKEDEAGALYAVIQQPDEEMYGLSADQILTSHSFGLRTTRDPDFFKRLEKAARQARTGDPDATLRFMRMSSTGAAAEDPQPPPEGRKVSQYRVRKQAARTVQRTGKRRSHSR